MAKISLRATGGLNQDIDPNNLPEGDYLSANNIVFDAGKDGGAGAIRMLDSIKTTGLTAISGTIVDTAQDTDGSIYVLAFVTTVASIYKIGVNSSTGALENPILVLSYTHGATNGLIPDLRIIGDSLVWNYAGNGTPLSFWLKRTLGNTVALEDLTLQKATPNNVATIVKTVTAGTSIAIEFLESTDFQFAYRYQYDNYEYSALSNYTQVYKGEKDTVKYTFNYSFTGKPTYAKYLEVYTRVGNNGTWRRIDSNLIGTDSATFEWTGQIFESLDIITTGKPFDAVPVWAKNIEVAKNRIFLANIQDDYDTTNTISIAIADGYTLPAGSTLKSYLGDSAVVSSSETDASSYVKPFANNSTYAIGVAYYDKAMKTRGVEKYEKFTTGKFATKIIPTVTVTFTTAPPSWAKYAQLVYTKNISKSYIFEGYASSIFFELKKTNVDEKTKEVTTLLSFVQSVTKDDLKEINAFVIDMMGMIRAGRIYTWQQGDYVSIKTPNGVLDLKIIGQNDNLLYCAYSGDVMTNTTTVDPSLLAFEIFTPKQQQEDESLVFYEYGNLVDISAKAAGSNVVFSGSGTLNSNTTSKLLGDMVFSTIDMPTYVTSPFTTDTSKGSPVVEDVVTTVNSTHNFSNLSHTYPSNDIIKTESPVFTSISSSYSDVILNSSNVANSTGTSFKTTGYYVIGEQDAGVNKMTVAYNLQVTKALSQNTPTATEVEGKFDWALKMQVWKVPYNNTTNKYDLGSETFGEEVYITADSVNLPPSTPTMDYVGTHTIELNKLKNDINPNDRFEVRFSLTVDFQGAINTASIAVNRKAASANSVVVTLNGDRTPVKTITSYNYNAEVSATKTKYLFRSISNAITNPYWNTSSGKPLLSAQNIVTTPRTNTIRYGGNYVQGTKINNISSFFSLDSNDVAIENGEITGLQRASRLQGNGSMMIVLCKRESAYIMLGEQELSQGNNASIRSLTANMIGTIRNFGNNLGMIDKRSVMNYKGTIWWWDDFNKKVVKYTPDGLEIPSDTYMRSTFRSKSGIASFSYDPFHNMCFIAVGNETQSLGYSDNLKRWIAAYDFVPSFAESYGDRMLLFKAGSGVLYRSLESGTKNDYNAFFGNAAANGNIKFVVNSQLPVMPLNVAVLHNMNVIDYNQPNGIKTSLLTVDITNENGQTSTINETNWLLEDNRIYAHVMRDSSSTGGIIEGNYIVGYLNNFLLTLKDKTQNMRVNSIDIEVSPITGHS